jgi:hypothetical protein
MRQVTQLIPWGKKIAKVNLWVPEKSDGFDFEFYIMNENEFTVDEADALYEHVQDIGQELLDLV